MRVLLLFALALSACSPARTPSTLAVAPTETTTPAPPTMPPPQSAAAAEPGVCRIRGDGEVEARAPVEVAPAKPLAVYASEEASSPVLIVGNPGAIRVAWEFRTAPPTNGAPLARVELGGEKLVRYRGLASGLERGFQLRRRNTGGDDRDRPTRWFRAGTEVEVLHAWETGYLRVRPRTGLAAHQFIDVPCDEVVYQPTRIVADDGPERSATTLRQLGELHLLEEPAMPTHGFSDSTAFGLPEVWLHEKRDGFTRVTADHFGEVIDAWVPDGDLAHRYVPRRRPAAPAAPPAEPRNKSRRARVKVDAPLHVGGTKIDGAFVEAGAEIYLEGVEGGRTSFSFVAGEDVPALLPPAKKTFSIPSDTIAR